MRDHAVKVHGNSNCRSGCSIVRFQEMHVQCVAAPLCCPIGGRHQTRLSIQSSRKMQLCLAPRNKMRSLSRCGKSDIRINTRQDNMCCEHIRRDLQAEREHDVNTFLIPPTNQEISRHHKCIAKAR